MVELVKGMVKEKIEVRLANEMEMKDSKRIDFHNYSGAELLYLLSGVLSEVDRRDRYKGMAASSVDSAVSMITHMIEFTDVGDTTTGKAKAFDDLSQALADRRHLKQEIHMNNRLYGLLNLKPTRTAVTNYTTELIRDNPNRDKVNRIIPTYKQGEYKRLSAKHIPLAPDKVVK